jgi:hypothetical protein
MPSIEQEGNAPDPERPSASYSLIARFQYEPPARRAYFRAQEAVFTAQPPADLSVYRFQLDRISHVAVIGEPPPQELERTLRAILATGIPASLPAEVLKQLQDRRTRMSAQGLWVEGHYRPGRRL